METIDETALTNQAPLPNQSDFGGRLDARPISQPRCQRTIAEGIRSFTLFSRMHASRTACATLAYQFPDEQTPALSLPLYLFDLNPESDLLVFVICPDNHIFLFNLFEQSKLIESLQAFNEHSPAAEIAFFDQQQIA